MTDAFPQKWRHSQPKPLGGQQNVAVSRGPPILETTTEGIKDRGEEPLERTGLRP